MSYSFASWNVNGLRACVKKGFMDFLCDKGFDIMGIQEIKMLPEQSAVDFTTAGYHPYWHPAQKKGYSGTLVLTKEEPIDVMRGMGSEEEDSEGRVLTLEFPKFYFTCIYSPNSQDELARLGFRMDWQDRLCKYIAQLKAKKHVVICGDLNVAHKEIDLKNPKTNTKNAGFTPEERKKMDELLDLGFIDSFRHMYPDKTDAYTWWSYRSDAREKNVGWRIDYFLVSDSIKDCIKEAFIYEKVLGSDHCPIGLELTL